ncbi:hypothetical protein BDQ17DRAFT_1405234 [Cyathus striatus]|nr:hypothetical protein BDQ17DRAFT_1405234 [Cyathus striatus]
MPSASNTMQLRFSLFAIIFIALSAVASVIPSEIDSTDAWSDQALQQHKTNRAKYGARPLSWNANLHPGTLQWAKQCKFQHRQQEPETFGISNAMNSWMAEASKYDCCLEVQYQHCLRYCQLPKRDHI